MFGRARSWVSATSVVVSSLCVAPFVGASVAQAGTDVTAVTGTPGNAQVALSWTAPTDTTFPVTFNGSNYNSVFIGSNTYITFGSGSSAYNGLSASNPAIPGVHMCAADNSYQRVQYLINTAVTPNQLRVRYEGTASTGGTAGSPNIVYEAVFYKDQNYFDVLIGNHARCTSGTRLITNGSSQLSAPAFAAYTNWRITGGTASQNGNSATWLGSSSASVAPNASGYTSLFDSSADDSFLQVPVAPTGYAIRYSSNSGSSWTTFTTNTGSTSTSSTVTGLVNGTSYIFQVAAYYSSTGQTGPWSTSSPAYVPLGAPSAPLSPVSTAGNTQVALTWAAPSSNAGSSITDYRVEYSSNGGGSWTVFDDGVSTTTSATVTGLVNGTSYTFRVAALNSQGTGSYATFTAATPFSVPGAPTTVTPTAGSSQATVSWTAPASNGGSAVTGYAIDYSSDGGSNWTTASANTGTTAVSYTVTGLTGGVNYVFRVAARNAAGQGSWSSTSGQASVYGVPATPDAPSVAPGNGQVSLSWTAPSNNGSAITGYAIQFSSNSGGSWTNWSTNTGNSLTTNTVTALVNGISYVFLVAERNASGQG
ncbi:MAG: fibronectin type III domain-containing protein [Actinomycetota bacterium]